MNNTCQNNENPSSRDTNLVDITGLQKTKKLEMANQPSLDYNLRNPGVQIVENNNIKHVYKKDGEMKSLIVGKKIELTDINKNIESLEIKYNLKIYTFDGRVIPIEGLKRKDINDKSKLLELSAYGSEINSKNVILYAQSLENQERFIEISNIHERIGWGMYDGQKIFKHVEALGMPYEHTSKYMGQLDISKGGTMEDWKGFIEKEVIGHTPLEAAIALGLSSVVVGFIGEHIGVTSQLFHIYGNSSTGKTTVGELIIGTATKPSLQNNGLMYSWSATINALIGNLRNNFGLPILFDDSSVSRLEKFSSLLYNLVQGRDKDRMNKEAEMKEAGTWRTSIISTGENSLLENSNQNEGLLVRVIEIGNVSWTKDAAHSERIKRKTSMYYGHAVEVVAKQLILRGEENILELVEKSKSNRKEYLESQGHYNRLHDRILNTIATIEIGITLIEQKLKLGFDIDSIMEFLLEQTLMDDRSIADKAYEDLLEYVASNSNRFNQNIYILDEDNNKTILLNKKPGEKYGKKETTISPNQKLLGKIEDISIEEVVDEDGIKKTILEREIAIPVKIFSGILKELGYNNPTGVLKDFKAQNLLSHDIDRNTRKRKLVYGGNTIAVNVIRVVEEVVIEKEKEVDINELYGDQRLEEHDGEIDF